MHTWQKVDASDTCMFVQGNCREPLDSIMLQNAQGFAALDEVRRLQCLILTDVALGTVSQNTWLHNLYIRHHTTGRESSIDMVLWCDTPDCNLWLTFMTLQGYGGYGESVDLKFGGLAVTAGQMYSDGAAQSHYLHVLHKTLQLILFSRVSIEPCHFLYHAAWACVLFAMTCQN